MTMGKHRKNLIFVEGPYLCYFRCGNILLSKYNRAAVHQWNWFCGYFKEPVHFCHDCQNTRGLEINMIKTRSEIKPLGYPDNYADPAGVAKIGPSARHDEVSARVGPSYRQLLARGK